MAAVAAFAADVAAAAAADVAAVGIAAANVAAETTAVLSDRRRTSGARTRIGCNHFRWPTDIADRHRLCESVVYSGLGQI